VHRQAAALGHAREGVEVARHQRALGDAEVLVDQIERNVADGRDLRAAIVEATVARFRPIMLTAAAAVLALIPLTRNVFWGPMSAAMMGGLVVATLLTVTFLPALYAAWFRVKRPRPVAEPVPQLAEVAAE
jgi:Cu/Ag efflux pump CusA